MTYALSNIESLSVGESLEISLLGFSIVFGVLVLLMIVIRLLVFFVNKPSNAAESANAQTEASEASPAASSGMVPARGSLGEVKLYGLEDKTAAMVMAIVADEIKAPLNELRFLSIKERQSGGKSARETESKNDKEMTAVMKYNVTLKDKVYEVEVERGEAALISVSDYAPVQSAPAVPSAAAPAPAAVSAPAANSAADGDAALSPMPGSILSVNASEGDAVKAGQVILILEAMKMENEITAPRDGKISKIYVSKGSKVETGTPLFTLA